MHEEPKPGCTSYVQVIYFYPISLTYFLLKTLEGLVDRYVKDGTLVRYQLHFYWHAYQSGRSVKTAPHSLDYKIERALEDGLVALGASWTWRVHLAAPALIPYVSRMVWDGARCGKMDLCHAQKLADSDSPNGLYDEGIC
jgi:hypothetical protein